LYEQEFKALICFSSNQSIYSNRQTYHIQHPTNKFRCFRFTVGIDIQTVTRHPQGPWRLSDWKGTMLLN
jgi:hypothetical protein